MKRVADLLVGQEHTIFVVTNHRHWVALRGLVWTLIP
jgi:hypothetical protein